MSPKEYTSVDYIGQRLREAITTFLSKKTGGEFSVSYQYNPAQEKSFIKYSLMGLETTLVVLRDKEAHAYSLQEIVCNKNGEGDPLSDTYNLIYPKRSPTGRLSEEYLKSFVQDRIDVLRNILNRK